MTKKENYLVTGAFSYTGKFIAKELLSNDKQVCTLTGHPDEESPYFDKVKVFPYNFGDFNKLVDSLLDVNTFINTYWVRFPKKNVSWEDAISNSKMLFDACVKAGVKDRKSVG